VRREKEEEEEEGEEEELRIIEKPVVHPDRRFISRARSTTCIYPSFSPIISPFFHRASPPRSLSRFFLPSSPSLARPRNKKNEEKGRGGKRGERQQISPAEAWRGEASGAAGTGRPRATMPAEVHSRAITDAVAGGPLTNGSVNHGRFKVITHRRGGGRKNGGKKKGVNGCRRETKREREREKERGRKKRQRTRPVGHPAPIDHLIYGGDILSSGQDESRSASYVKAR